MEIYLDMTQAQADETGWRDTDQGIQMKFTSGWNNGGNGTNSSGFNAIPGGRRPGGSFRSLGNIGHWWSSTEAYSRDRSLNGDVQVARNGNFSKTYSLSIRCIKD